MKQCQLGAEAREKIAKSDRIRDESRRLARLRDGCGRRENANGAGRGHVSAMYPIPPAFPLPSTPRRDGGNKRGRGESHPSRETRELTRRRQRRKRRKRSLLRCRRCRRRRATPFQRFAPDPEMGGGWRAIATTRRGGVDGGRERLAEHPAFDASHYGNATSRASWKLCWCYATSLHRRHRQPSALCGPPLIPFSFSLWPSDPWQPVVVRGRRLRAPFRDLSRIHIKYNRLSHFMTLLLSLSLPLLSFSLVHLLIHASNPSFRGHSTKPRAPFYLDSPLTSRSSIANCPVSFLDRDTCATRECRSWTEL